MPNPKILINLLKATKGAKKIPLPYKKWAEPRLLDLPSGLAKRVRYEGVQEKFLGMSKEGKILTKPGAFTFTDLRGGSTFMVPLEKDLNWEVWKTLQKMDKQNFSKGGK